MTKALIALLSVLSGLAGCASPPDFSKFQTSYHPISPISVRVFEKKDDKTEIVAAPDAFDFEPFPENETGLFGMETSTLSANANVPGTLGSLSSASARVVNDFIMYRTFPLPIIVKKTSPNTANDGTKSFRYTIHYNASAAKAGDTTPSTKPSLADTDFEGTIPVYIGVGIRILADVSSNSGNVNFGSLPAIAAAVSAQQAMGEISVASMGVTGKSISLLIQQPISLNEATVQSALQSVGAIKASLAAASTQADKSAPGSATQAFQLHPQVIGFDCMLQDVDEIRAIQQFVANTTFKIDVIPTSGSQNAYEVSVADAPEVQIEEEVQIAQLQKQLKENKQKIAQMATDISSARSDASAAKAEASKAKSEASDAKKKVDTLKTRAMSPNAH